MPRRKSKFQPDRQIRLLRQYRGDDREYAWEVIGTAYAMRRDMRGDAPEGDGEYRYSKTVTFILPKTIRYSEPADAAGSDAMGARELGEVPAGGRGEESGQRQRAYGTPVQAGDAVQDTGTYGSPIFRVTDVHEMLDRKRIELIVERTDVQGAIYGGD